MSEMFEIAKKLSQLPPTTDSNDWPERKEILYQQENYGLWAQICLLAAVLAEDFVTRIWLVIEYVNGLRRQPGLWGVNLALNMLDEIKQRIDRLTDDYPQKQRLAVLWVYHGGWVYHPAGEFGKSAECHELSAEIARKAGDKRGELLANHNATMERLNAAIVENKIPTSYYQQFDKANQELLKILVTNSDEDIRWKANVYCHQMWYAWLVKREQPDQGKLEFLRSLEKTHPPIFPDATDLFRAIQVLNRQPKLALVITAELEKRIKDVDWRTYALLVHAYAQHLADDEESAISKLQQIETIAEKEHGGHLAQAIIKHHLIW